METTTVLLVGVGGQGTILAGDLLAQAAAMSGCDVKISEIHGMSQRGGSVSTVVRFGDEVKSMVADPGCADYIVSFEALEALRAVDLLKKDQGRLFVNTEEIVPLSVAIAKANMPPKIQEQLKTYNAVLINASKIACTLGSPKSSNVVLMGALSPFLPFDLRVWHEVIPGHVPPKTSQINLKAFDAGREYVKNHVQA